MQPILIQPEVVEASGLTPNEYCFLYHKHVNNRDTYKDLVDIAKLEREGWCKDSLEGVIIRLKFQKILPKSVVVSPVSEWIDEWRDLWPRGVKTSGRPVKGDKSGCTDKMTEFCKKHPEYSKEEIFSATRQYIFEKRREDYRAMQCADYFISKNKISLLAAILEDLDGRQTLLDDMEQGEDNPFYKSI